MKRPDMSSFFKAQINRHVNGFLATNMTRLPQDVRMIKGDVTDSVITVTMLDGSTFKWSGGRYAARKVNLCYAPLMPKPIKD